MVFLVKNQLVGVNLQTYARHLKISQAHTNVFFRKTIDIFPGSLSILSISRCEMLFDLHQPSEFRAVTIQVAAQMMSVR